jgi:two-component system LytT family response regulator
VSDLRVLVVDDEPLAREMVAELVRADPDVASVLECGDATQVSAVVAAQRPDIVFLDVEMPEASGIEVASRLAPDGPVTVFITAFSRYATDAFDVRSTDYVLKPFSDARFREALERAKQRVRERQLLELAERAAPDPGETSPADTDAGSGSHLERLTLKDGESAIVIKTSDIVWAEAQDYYVRIHSSRGRHLVRTTLALLEERLNPTLFLRVHRGAIVNLDAVTGIDERDGMRLLLAGGGEVPVSRARRRQLRTAISPRLRGR